jgi:UDP-N-acetylenolpyruvoylglucosamine reductase
MNAGTGKESLFDNLLTLTIVTDAGTCETLNKDKIQYSYRKCPTLDNAIAVKAIFQGKKCNEAIIKAKRDNGRKKRLENQPLGLSLGCFFKNTLDEPTGKLLDKLGLREGVSGRVMFLKSMRILSSRWKCKFPKCDSISALYPKTCKATNRNHSRTRGSTVGAKMEDFL